MCLSNHASWKLIQASKEIAIKSVSFQKYVTLKEQEIPSILYIYHNIKVLYLISGLRLPSFSEKCTRVLPPIRSDFIVIRAVEDMLLFNHYTYWILTSMCYIAGVALFAVLETTYCRSTSARKYSYI